MKAEKDKKTGKWLIGDEEKDYMTALNAGCNFMYISDFINLV